MSVSYISPMVQSRRGCGSLGIRNVLRHSHLVMYKVSEASEDSLGPYAWDTNRKRHVDVNVGPAGNGDISAKNIAGLDQSITSSPRAAPVFGAITLDDKIHLRLPKSLGTPGYVLRHAIEVFEDLHSRRKPMSFKFGFTHDPVFRWTNPIYGYVNSVQKYERMDILYVSDEATGPGFLEAALVNLYKGGWDATIRYMCMACDLIQAVF